MKNEFVQHALVVMTANKYKVDCLAEQALGRLKQFVCDEADNENRSLFVYAIPKLYQHQTVASRMRWCISESKRFRDDRIKKDKVANEEGEDETMREVGDSDDEEVVDIRNGTEAVVISDNEDDDSTKAQAIRLSPRAAARSPRTTRRSLRLTSFAPFL